MTITSGIGLFSGINTRSIIDQLLAIDARPALIFRRRIFELQLQQTAYLDINARMNTLKTAAAAFRINKTFDAKRATSGDSDVLTGTASTGAQPGSFIFLVDRLVSTQQQLSRGFADRDLSAFGANQFTFESAEGRLDRDLRLSELNGGQGIERGEIIITQNGNQVTVDLSKAVTVTDVLDAINTDAGLDLTATVSDGKIVLTATVTGAAGAFAVTDGLGHETATSLGIAGSSTDGGSGHALAGSNIYLIGTGTALSALNDKNGIFIDTDIGETRFDFIITVDPGGPSEQIVKVNIGKIFDAEATQLEGPSTTVGKVLERINTALSDAGVTDLTAGISADGTRLVLNNTGPDTVTITDKVSGTSARDLGLLTTTAVAGTITGARILSDINGTLLSNINGGSGLSGTGAIALTARDGTAFNVDISGAETVEQVISIINNDAANAGRLVATLNGAGTGLLITDTTGGAGNLIITGDGADDLGLATDPAGIAADTVLGTSLQHAYVTEATLVKDLNNGRGIGIGKFRITDGNGIGANVDIDSSTLTVLDLLKEINGQLNAANVNAQARLNDKGDGILIEERAGQPNSSSPISVTDETGAVARNLNIRGTAEGTGVDNVIDGSAETIVEFDTTDTLDDIIDKINQSGAQATASVISDGGSANAFRISFVSRNSGRDGRFTLDTHGFDLGLRSLEQGEDARVFFGSSDPANGVLLTSSTNTLDSVITGVTIDLHSTNASIVELNISRDTAEMEAKVEEFVSAFNAVIDRIDTQSRFSKDTGDRGPLLGDSTTQTLRLSLFRTVQSPAEGLSGTFSRLVEVGITVGSGGTIELDRERFREALEEDFDSVADLFDTRDLVAKDEFIEVEPGVKVRNTGSNDEFSALGVAGLIEQLSKTYTDTIDGRFKIRGDAIATQIDLQNGRIDALNIRLATKRTILERQFLAMEQAIALLQSQQGALNGLGFFG